MTRQSKKNSHIWDNLPLHGVSRNPYFFNDTTGCSTMSFVEYSREEITVVSPPRASLCTVKNPKRAEKPRGDVYVTNREREIAEQPKQLATWKYSPIRKEKYNPHAVADAFAAYQHRIQVKKWAEPVRHATRTHHHQHTTRTHTTHHKKQVTINETANEIVEDTCPKYQKVRLTNERNDEIKIDNFTSTKTVSEDVEEVELEVEDVRIQKKKKTSSQKPGFYGTIEAELCAEQAAAHLSLACENLERLQFVTDAVYPQNASHLRKLHEIDEDIKDFNSQMRRRRVRVPTSAGTTTQIAHFIINDNGY